MQIKGPWQVTHLEEHQEMYNVLVKLLSDLSNCEKLPMNRDNVDWEKISVAYLIQWTLENASNINHIHKEEK